MVFAHANGFSGDESLLVLVPITVLAAILLYVNNKLRRALDDPLLDEGGFDPLDDRSVGDHDRDTHDDAAPAGADPRRRS